MPEQRSGGSGSKRSPCMWRSLGQRAGCRQAVASPTPCPCPPTILAAGGPDSCWGWSRRAATCSEGHTPPLSLPLHGARRSATGQPAGAPQSPPGSEVGPTPASGAGERFGGSAGWSGWQGGSARLAWGVGRAGECGQSREREGSWAKDRPSATRHPPACLRSWRWEAAERDGGRPSLRSSEPPATAAPDYCVLPIPV